MAFSFGNTSVPAFGSTAQKPTGFAAPFGSVQPTTTQSTNFGFGQSQSAATFGSTFGAAPTSAPPAFGSTQGFGAQPAASTSVFGSAFGTPASSAAPAFGTTFGTTQTQGATGIFGQATSKPSTLFGTPATSTTGLFGAAQTTTPGLFGTSQTVASTPSLFAATATTPSLFGTSFGQPAVSAAPAPSFGGGLFGAVPQSSAPSLFGSSSFGTTTTSSFGGFGAATTSTGGFGGFGTGTTTGTGLFGQKPAQPTVSGVQAAQQTTTLNKNQQIIASVYAINIFNDERDDILKKWNMLQACWGTGKGFYNSQLPPVEYTPQNPFYRFKAMGYNVIPEQDNSEGIVKLVFNRKVTELRNQQDILKNGLAGILGNRPNLTVDIVLLKATTDSQTEVKMCVSEKGVTGINRKIPATELAAFLNQPMQKQQLTNVGVLSVTPFVTPSKAELEEYLKNPPPGIEPQMWQAAIQDNPNPKKYIPVSINGFSDLRARMLNQEYQTGLHSAFLEKVDKDIKELKTKHASSLAHIADLKQKFLELQHRVLRVLVKQESTRKVGVAIQPEEEVLRGRLELMYTQLNQPKQFKGQINELLSHVKLLETSAKQSGCYRIDADAQEDIRQFLKMEQSGISQLVNIVNNDIKALQIISDGYKELLEKKQFR
ncbi:nucleoporin p54 isoform X2 [Anthonomus grandis grandis]|uniref:nucleoporin p54 isoform X2 n=1 Tax=Anthonomus grandis grandis TaxID=2921223 RepID=UPI002165E8AE|nr:nucleoporin p54 isoform X2 [Anthonomus grandis grandis]